MPISLPSSRSWGCRKPAPCWGRGALPWSTDPTKHTRIRSLINGVFTPEFAENMRGHTQQIVDELIDRVEHTGQMDIVGHLARPAFSATSRSRGASKRARTSLPHSPQRGAKRKD